MTHGPCEYGRCRTCGGPLQILDANRSLTVTCVECADSYNLDPDDFDDGQMSNALPATFTIGEKGGAA